MNGSVSARKNLGVLHTLGAPGVEINFDDCRVPAGNILRDVQGIGFTYFANKDVVRHPLVQRIVEAYDTHEDRATPLDSGKL